MHNNFEERKQEEMKGGRATYTDTNSERERCTKKEKEKETP
jgi:hypothetical protein